MGQVFVEMKESSDFWKDETRVVLILETNMVTVKELQEFIEEKTKEFDQKLKEIGLEKVGNPEIDAWYGTTLKLSWRIKNYGVVR